MPKQRNTKFHTIDEVAGKLGQSSKSVRRKLKAGDIPYYRFGTSIRIGDGDLEAYIEECRVINN